MTHLKDERSARLREGHPQDPTAHVASHGGGGRPEARDDVSARGDVLYDVVVAYQRGRGEGVHRQHLRRRISRDAMQECTVSRQVDE